MTISTHNRSRALLGLSAALALGLSGCNGSDDGGPAPVPTPVLTPTAALTPTPTVNPFGGAYTGTYRVPSTGEVGTFEFTVAPGGSVLGGSVAIPLSGAIVPITGTVSSAGVLRASGTIGSGAGSRRIAIEGSVRNVGASGVASGTFTSTSANSTLSGTASAREVTSQPSIYEGSYAGTFVNPSNTNQSGGISVTVQGTRIRAALDAAITNETGISGTVQAVGIIDLSTGQFTASGPFARQGLGGSTAQMLGLSGRLAPSGSTVVGSGTFIATPNGRGTFRIGKAVAVPFR